MPFTAQYLVPGQTVGRFDLGDRPPVRYLAESPEHAIAEVLSGFRGTEFRSAYLRHSGYPLALMEVKLSSSLVARPVDLANPKGDVKFAAPIKIDVTDEVVKRSLAALGMRVR